MRAPTESANASLKAGRFMFVYANSVAQMRCVSGARDFAIVRRRRRRCGHRRSKKRLVLPVPQKFTVTARLTAYRQTEDNYPIYHEHVTDTAGGATRASNYSRRCL